MPPPLLLHVFSTFKGGGVQVRFATLANRFGRAWRHAIIAMDGDVAARGMLDPSLDVSFPDLALHKGDTLGNIGRIRAYLGALRPHALVTSNWGTIEWALANAVPLTRPLAAHLHLEDGFGPEEQDRQLPRRVWLRRLALRRSRVVVPSRTLETIARKVWRLDRNHVTYVPNGIDLTRFTPAARPAGAETVIGTVAALRAEKNIARLLRAFAALPNAPPSRLVVAGDGPERPALQDLAASLGLGDRVGFLGHLPHPEQAYAGFDLFALSSDTEQMPLSVLEAMAAGLPVAATDVGDVAAMLSEPNRAFVVPRQDGAVAGALAALIADAGLRRSIGAANRARVERDFDQERMFETYAALFARPGPASISRSAGLPGTPPSGPKK